MVPESGQAAAHKVLWGIRMKRFNEKSKAEQLFMLLLLFAGLFGLLCLSGCGGVSCETPKCGKGEPNELMTAKGISLPGCGGCLTPGKGCNCAIWPQSCKYVTSSLDDDQGMSVTACDIRYYGGGCLGCNQNEKSCYYGCVNFEEDGESTLKVCGGGKVDEIYGFIPSGVTEGFIGCQGACVIPGCGDDESSSLLGGILSAEMASGIL